VNGRVASLAEERVVGGTVPTRSISYAAVARSCRFGADSVSLVLSGRHDWLEEQNCERVIETYESNEVGNDSEQNNVGFDWIIGSCGVCEGCLRGKGEGLLEKI